MPLLYRLYNDVDSVNWVMREIAGENTFWLIGMCVDSIGFWRWCITHRINGYSDFVHRPDSKDLEDENTTFRELDLFPSSGEGRHLLCWVS
jgi:hypothetical protein